MCFCGCCNTGNLCFGFYERVQMWFGFGLVALCLAFGRFLVNLGGFWSFGVFGVFGVF